jgi:hypothetical protein
MSCGVQSPVVKTDLAALRSLKNTRKELKGKTSSMVPAMGFSIILGVIPIAILIWIFASFINNESNTIGKLMINLSLKSVLISLFVPMLLLPFSLISNQRDYSLKLKDLLLNMKHYPKYLLFALINAVVLMVLYLVCFGFPGFASDPILRLVWIVLINYWLAIALPAVVVMEIKQVNPLKALKLSYQHFTDVRWNIYLLALLMVIFNGLAFALAIFPLLFTLPVMYFSFRDYVLKLEEYELLEYRL